MRWWWIGSVAVMASCAAGTEGLSARDARGGADGDLAGDAGRDVGGDARDASGTARDGGDVELVADAAVTRADVLRYCEALVTLSETRRIECYGGTAEAYRARDDEAAYYASCARIAALVEARELLFVAERADQSLRAIETSSCATIFAVDGIRSWLEERRIEPLSAGGLTWRRRADGESCDAEPDRCAAGLACAFDPETTESDCRPAREVDEGQPCDDTRLCRGGWCSRSVDDVRCARPGICIVRPGAGEPCDTEIGCAEGTHCEGATGLCTPTGGEGSRCFDPDAMSPDSDGCPLDLLCQPRPLENAYVCERPPKVGQRCDIRRGTWCITGQRYTRCAVASATTSSVRRCALLGVVGDPCDDFTDCWSADCVAGRCVRHKVTGEACGTHAECWSGRCFDGACEAPPRGSPPQCR